MKLRKRDIYIGGSKYTFDVVDKLYGPHRKGSTILGQHNPRNGTIKLLKKLNRELNTTLLHEILHAVAWEHDLRMCEDVVDTVSRELSGALGQLGVLK